MKEEFDHIDDLIGKYLAGETTANEHVEVETWIQQSALNQQHFDQIKLIFEKAAAVKGQQHFDTDEAWIKLKARLDQSKVRAITFSLWPALRIAAGVVILISASYFGYQWLNTPVEKMALRTEGEIVRDTLPDGSHAVLNKSSSITYAYHPRKNERKVLLEGEAFFDVKHDEEKPFIIETQEVLIKDIGTTFNVKAFAESETVEVYVETGEVEFYTLTDPGLNLVAGETGIYNKKNKSFARLQQVDTNKLAYKTGYFTFHNADLASIVEDLNMVYTVQIKLSHKALHSCRLNVSFRNERIEDIVEIIAETLHLTIRKEGNNVVLDGKGCDQ